MKKYRILICDDDYDFANRIKENYFQKYQDIFEVFIQNDTTFSLDEHYHAYILDIEMPSKSGFDLAKEIYQKYPQALLVFLTTHEEFTADGYEYNAFRFVSKYEVNTRLPRVLNQMCEKLNEMYQYIEAKNEEGILERVYLHTISYICSDKNYLNIKSGNQIFRIRQSIKAFEEQVNVDYFVCPQQGILVNLRSIKRLEMKQNMMILDTGDKVKITRKYKESFLARYTQGIY